MVLNSGPQVGDEVTVSTDGSQQQQQEVPPPQGVSAIPIASPMQVMSVDVVSKLLDDAVKAAQLQAIKLVAAVTEKPTETTPVFTRKGFQQQFEFNAQIIKNLTIVIAEDRLGVHKERLQASVELLNQRNQTLVVADRKPEVFAYLESREQAEKYKTSNPILAEFVVKSDKEDAKSKEKAHSSRSRSPIRRPFRAGGVDRQPAPRNVFHRYSEEDRPSTSSGYRGSSSYSGRPAFGSSRHGPQGIRGTRPAGTCYRCGNPGHWARECKVNI